MAEFKANKAGRRPFPIGTKVDVILRISNSSTQLYTGDCVSFRMVKEGDYAGNLEVTGAVVAEADSWSGIRDWKIENTPGDVLAYRKHEGEANEQG